MREYLGIPTPMLTLESHQEVLMSIKEAVEVLTRQRGDKENSAAMLKDIADRITEAPRDNRNYVRKGGEWKPAPPLVQFEYTFNATFTVPPPGSGFIRMNNVDQTLATVLYISDAMHGGMDVSGILANMGPGIGLLIRDTVDETKWRAYNIVGNLTDAAGYVEVPVAYVQGGSPLLAQRVTMRSSYEF